MSILLMRNWSCVYLMQTPRSDTSATIKYSRHSPRDAGCGLRTDLGAAGQRGAADHSLSNVCLYYDVKRRISEVH